VPSSLERVALLAIGLMAALVAWIKFWRTTHRGRTTMEISGSLDRKEEYSFRVRVNRSPNDTIECQENEINLPTGGLCKNIRLRNTNLSESIKNAPHWSLIGDGFSTAADAAASGRRIEVAFMLALARSRVGADFGSRAPKGLFTNAGLRLLEQQNGQRMLNDDHGSMVYSSEPSPRFVSFSAKLLRGANREAFQNDYAQALAATPNLSEREVLAFDLFNASFFQTTADTRFLLLTMAIEAIIELSDRDALSVKHVASLVAATKAAAIPDADKQSILGSLAWLRQESIGQGGRRLVTQRLGNRLYEGKVAANYFTDVYHMRSSLVHGSIPYPTFNDVSRVVGNLEVFVSDLLTAPILGPPAAR
jgi:hypothetical protein